MNMSILQSLKPKELDFYMGVAKQAASMSHAVRRKVGCTLVTENGVMVYGYNGTLKGQDNVCEIEVDGELVTKDAVMHAERNALAKAGREGLRTQGSYVFITLSPCVGCATLLASFGVKGVVFEEQYRDSAGIYELLDAGVEVYRHHVCSDGIVSTEQYIAHDSASGRGIIIRGRRNKCSGFSGRPCSELPAVQAMSCTC